MNGRAKAAKAAGDIGQLMHGPVRLPTVRRCAHNPNRGHACIMMRAVISPLHMATTRLSPLLASRGHAVERRIWPVRPRACKTTMRRSAALALGKGCGRRGNVIMATSSCQCYVA